MHPHLHARAAARGGIFSRQDAVSAGYSGSEIDRFVARRHWIAVRRGVYVECARWEAADAAELALLAGAAAIAVLQRPAVISHLTAAVIAELPLLGYPRRDGPPRPTSRCTPSAMRDRAAIPGSRCTGRHCPPPM